MYPAKNIIPFLRLGQLKTNKLIQLLNYLFIFLTFSSVHLINNVQAQSSNAWQSLPLVSHLNQPIKINDAHGKYALINFTFTDCVMYCTVQTQQLLTLRNKLAYQFGEENFEMFSISLTPERDTFKGMHGFAKRFSAQGFSNWHFATGNVEAVQKIMNTLEVKIAKGKEAGQLNHTTFVYLLDPHGNLIEIFQGVPVDDDAVLATFSKHLTSKNTQLMTQLNNPN